MFMERQGVRGGVGGVWGFDEEEAESKVTVPGDIGPDKSVFHLGKNPEPFHLQSRCFR